MSIIPIPAGSSSGQFAFQGEPKLTNCHAEATPGGKAKFNIVPSDGLTTFGTTSDTPCRGLAYLEDLDKVIDVRSGTTFDVVSTGTATAIGIIPGIDRVRIVRNRKQTPQIVLHCDAGVYIEEGTTLGRFVLDTFIDNFTTVADIAEVDGFLIYFLPDGRFFFSASQEAMSIDPLDFETVNQQSDKGIAVRTFSGYLWFFCHKHIYPWKDTGGTDSPFTPMPQAIPKGCLTKYSIAECDNTLMWIADDGIVYRLNGFNAPTRISNHEIERLIQAETDPTQIQGFSWTKGGHAFYCIRGVNFTKAYDANTQQWCDRKTYGQTNWRINHTVAAWNKIIGGDSLSGKLLYLDATVFTEDSGVMVQEIVMPTISAFPNYGIVDQVSIDYVTGKGVVSPTAQGYDPLLMLDYSKDGGYTFKGERLLKTGQAGVYNRKINAHRFGLFRDKGIVFRMRQSDPTPRTLVMFDIQARKLAA